MKRTEHSPIGTRVITGLLGVLGGFFTARGIPMSVATNVTDATNYRTGSVGRSPAQDESGELDFGRRFGGEPARSTAGSSQTATSAQSSHRCSDLRGSQPLHNSQPLRSGRPFSRKLASDRHHKRNGSSRTALLVGIVTAVCGLILIPVSNGFAGTPPKNPCNRPRPQPTPAPASPSTEP